MSERRASKRGRGVAVAFTIPRTNPRTAKFCLDLWTPSNLCCSGCINFAGSFKLPIDYSEKDALEKLQSAIATRNKTHPSERCYCRQPWTWTEEQCVGKNNERWVSSVVENAASQALKSEDGNKQKAYASSFPSERYMRDNMLDAAAESLIY